MATCPFRQLTESLWCHSKFRFAKNVVGKLPKTAGQLPTLLRIKWIVSRTTAKYLETF